MEICHAHNLARKPEGLKLYGIRVSLPAGDTFTRLIGTDWEQFHWFDTSRERDRTLEDMASEHLYSRDGDRPQLIFEAVEAEKQSDSD